MTKNELLKKVKFMEMAIENGENLDLLAVPVYGYEGQFVKLEYYLGSKGLFKELNSAYLYEIITAGTLKDKSNIISRIKDSYCHCKPFDFENECNCAIPSAKEIENEYYEKLLEKINKRVESIKEVIK